jgi:hypothetical protein
MCGIQEEAHEMNTRDYVEKMNPTAIDHIVKEYADFSSVVGNHEVFAIAHSQSALLAFVFQVKDERQSITEREQHDFRHGFIRGYLYAMKCGNERESKVPPKLNMFMLAVMGAAERGGLDEELDSRCVTAEDRRIIEDWFKKEFGIKL